MIGDSLLNPSDVSFDGCSDVPPEDALLGDPIEESSCRYESWRVFEALTHCLGNHLSIFQIAPLMVSMMAQKEVH